MSRPRAAFLRGAAALGAATLGGAQAARGAGEEPLPLRVASLPIDLSGEAYYAQDLGFFKAGGLDVTISTIPFGQAIASAVAGGSADIGQSNIVSIAVAHEHGIPFVIVAPAGYYLSSAPTSLFLVLKSSPLRTPKDLVGKTVACNGLKNITQLSVQAWVDENGGDSSTIRFIEMPFTEMPAALAAGRVDAALMADPDATQALDGGNMRVFGKTFDAVGRKFLIGGWFATRDWVAAHPEAARRFVAVMRRTAAWANRNQARSAEILEKYTKVHVGNAHRVIYTDRLEPAEIQPQIDVAAKYKILKIDFPATDLIAVLPPPK